MALNKRILKALVFSAAASLTFISLYLYVSHKSHHGLNSPYSFKQNQTDGMTERRKIIAMLRHAWDGYEKYAFGADHLLTVSKRPDEWFGAGLTILDAIGTAYIMDQIDIYSKCRAWIRDEFKLKPEKYKISIFETNIRVVGGLLSTFELTNDKLFLKKAIEVADLLLSNFHPESGIPYTYMEDSSSSTTTVADAGSLSLTFKYLSFLTNDTKYWNAVMKISKNLRVSLIESDGMMGPTLTVQTGNTYGAPTIGAGADSYFEYLAKQYIQTSRIEDGFPPQWALFMKSVRKALKTSSKGHFMFVDGGNGLSNHLDCYLGGTIAFYSLQGALNAKSAKLTKAQLQDIDLAEELGRSCYELYHQTSTHLSPETVIWEYTKNPEMAPDALNYHKKPLNDSTISRYDPNVGTVNRLPGIDVPSAKEFLAIEPRYIHRPETMETLFYLYRITGKKQYRDMGWNIFLAYEEHLKMEDSGYSGLYEVDSLKSPKVDRMESFFFGDFIKYLYLLFSDESVISLDKFVFNTEAHPLPIFKPTPEFRKRVEWL